MVSEVKVKLLQGLEEHLETLFIKIQQVPDFWCQIAFFGLK